MINDMDKKKQRIRSVLILALILALSVCMTVIRGSKGNGANAVITVDGEIYATLPLDEDTQLTITDGKGGYNHIVVEAGTVYVSEADCANQVCVNTSAISHSGHVIACIPHGLVITVTDPGEEVDAVAY